MKKHMIKVEIDGIIYYTIEKALTVKGAIRKATRRIKRKYGNQYV